MDSLALGVEDAEGASARPPWEPKACGIIVEKLDVLARLDQDLRSARRSTMVPGTCIVTARKHMKAATKPVIFG